MNSNYLVFNLLIDLCNDSRFLRILYLFKVILNVICIVVPILLMVVLMFDVTKAIINSDDAKLNELKRKGITKIIMAVVVFLIPTIVSLFLSVLNFTGYDTCIENATLEKIEEAKERERIEKENERSNREQQMELNKNFYDAELNRIKIATSTTGSGSGGSISYDFSSTDDSILHQALSEFLSSKGTNIGEFNALIRSNIDKAGYQTREGVVAAAVTLVGELGDKYGVKIPYYWGGGHTEIILAPGNLGSDSLCPDVAANNRVYKYCGFDCTGFVMWAVRNAGFKFLNNSNFYQISGVKKVALSPDRAVIQAGDILESEHHAVLVVGVDEANKSYICVEAKGYDYGVLFTRRSFSESGYWGDDMTQYYQNNKLN